MGVNSSMFTVSSDSMSRSFTIATVNVLTASAAPNVSVPAASV